MQKSEEPILIPIEADFSGFKSAMLDMQKQSKQFESIFSSSIRSAIRNGKSFEDTLRSMALRISDMALKAGLRPLEKLASSALNQVFSGLGSIAGSALSSGLSPSVTPFAKGGIVSSPTLFSSNGGAGLMGEAGAEAILPLARGSDGRLGVRTTQGAASINVTFNISTPDVQGFRKSQGQLSAALTRALGRGRRGL